MFRGGLPVPEEVGKCGATSRDPGAHGAGRNAEHVGDLGVVHADEIAQRDRGAVVGTQAGERGVDVESIGDRGLRAAVRPSAPRVSGRISDGQGPTVAAPALRRARRWSRRGTPRSRTSSARRTSRSCGRWRAVPPGSRRARRRDCRESADTRRGRAWCDRAAARRAHRCHRRRRACEP